MAHWTFGRLLRALILVCLVPSAWGQAGKSQTAPGVDLAARILEIEASPKLLEPIMKVEVVTPEEYMGDIIGDLNSRRGLVNGMDQRANARVIDAQVPLANMFGYVNTLRSLSQGRAQFTMVFDHYAEVPNDIAEKVKAKNA